MSGFTALLHKYLDETLTAEEFEHFRLLLREPQNQEHFRQSLEAAMDAPVFEDVTEAVDDQALYRRIAVEMGPRVHRLFKWRWVAAAVLILAAAGYFLLPGSRENIPQEQVAEVPPGRAGAILTLADGSQVSLDLEGDTTVALQGGLAARMRNGVLTYEGKSREAVYNTISTPRGRQFRLTLPDGTQVWLNSASSIRYPTMFAGGARKVEITGEAYFDVKKAALPFVVNADNRISVTVLGTQFNLNAYDNEPVIHTTLVDGAVRVAAGSHNLVLRPGQQAKLRPGSGLKLVANADIEKVIAWKNGIFNFDKVPFAEAMRQLERWYDIEVVYRNGIPENIELMGKITKGLTLNDLLTVMEKIGVKCKLEGRKLIIIDTKDN